MISIDHFVQQEVEGEPLTTDTIKWAIRKFICMNFTPSKKEELDKYLSFIYTLGQCTTDKNREAIDKLIYNASVWQQARVNSKLTDEQQQALENETFYNLCNIE